MNEISKQKVENAFDIANVQMYDGNHNLYDMLHLKDYTLLVIEFTQTLISKVLDIIGVNNKNKVDTNELNKLHHSLCHLIKRKI